MMDGQRLPATPGNAWPILCHSCFNVASPVEALPLERVCSSRQLARPGLVAALCTHVVPSALPNPVGC